jgi:hypothetical protein
MTPATNPNTGGDYDTAGIAPEAEDMAANMAPDSDEMAMFRGLYEMHSPDGARALACPFRQVHRELQREPHIAIDDLGRISAPTLLVIGDDDLISIEHSAALFRAIPNSELAVVPGASHAVAIEKPELLNRIVLDFLQNEPVPTMMPLRRAATGAEMLYPDCLGKHPWPCPPHSAPLLATWAKTRCRVLPSCGAARP